MSIPGQSKKTVEYLCVILSFVLLGIFLWWHWRLGMTRYFDVDEFAHLSWAYQMLSGRIPYVDFLFYIPPGFQIFLMPLFALGSGVSPILAGRLVQFVLFVLLVGVTMLLFWIMRRSWVAILAGVILAFLPLPFDKFLEIRPDTLAMLFAMLGMIFQVLALQGLSLRGRKESPLVIAGVLYGISLLILPKTLPQVAIAVVIGILMRRNSIFSFFGGIAAPVAVFGLWALTLGNIDQVIYSLITLPLESKKISETFIMMPDLFFYPNTIFYGASGWSIGLLVNHAIWIVAILTGAYRLVSPGKSWAEFLIAATFFAHVIFYVLIAPLKHTQYLIPIALFVAFYAADAVFMLWEAAKKKAIPVIIFIIVITVIEVSLYHVFLSVNTPKLSWTNTENLRQLEAIYTTIPTTEYILDLTGETLYYKHPYVACCNEFGQFMPYLSHPAPSLSEMLEKTKTRYIYQGGIKRTTTLLPQDQAYITRMFLPVGDGALLKRKDTQ